MQEILEWHRQNYRSLLKSTELRLEVLRKLASGAARQRIERQLRTVRRLLREMPPPVAPRRSS